MTDFTQYDVLKIAHQKADADLLAAQVLLEQLRVSAQVNQAKITQLSTEISRLNAEIVRLNLIITGTTPPPLPQTGFKVYAGAEQPSTTFKRNVFVDPVNGNNETGDGTSAKPFKSLAYAARSSKSILPGDRVHMLAGDHAEVSFYGPYSAPNLQNSQEWVWLDFKPNSTVAGILLRQVKRFLITKPNLTKNTNFSGCEQIVLDSAIMAGSPKDPQTITVAEWMALPAFLDSRDTRYIAVTNCKVKNVREGITISCDSAVGKAPVNSAFALVEGNEILGASGDFSRMLASDIVFRKNKFLGGYASGDAGDGNHDDGMQGFAYPLPTFLKDAAGANLQPVQINTSIPFAEYSKILVEDNVFMDRIRADQVNWSDYQGFNIFDGVYSNITFRRNVILGGAYHGLSLYGVQGALIENNIVLSTQTPGTRSYDSFWIATPDSKGGLASKNVIAKNNIANKYIGGFPNPPENNNAVVKAADYASTFEKLNFVTGEFDFHIKSTSPLANRGLGIF